MIITVERPSGQAATSHIPRWAFSLSDAHYVWENAGADLRTFEGRQSIDCAASVRDAIGRILAAPEDFIGYCNYYDLRGTVAGLTGLFFTLREIPDGIVHVQ